MTQYLPRIRQAILFACWSSLFFSGCATDGNFSAGTAKHTIGSDTSKSAASLVNTNWKLIEINGKPAELGAGQKEISLITGGAENHVHGFSGCNRFSGAYKLTGDQLEFGRLATTRMACSAGMERETLFLAALNRVRRFSIEGERLTLYDNQNRAILRFVAVYLR